MKHRVTRGEDGVWRLDTDGPQILCRCRGELLCPVHFKLLSIEERRAYRAAHGEPVTAGRPS